MECGHGMANNGYQQIIRDSILDDQNFVNATFSGRQRGRPARWNRVVIRPVLIKDARYLQFSYFDDKKDISKNYIGDEVRHRLDEVLSEAFKNFAILTKNERI